MPASPSLLGVMTVVRCCYLTSDRTICCRYRDFRGQRRQPWCPAYLHCCQQARHRWQREPKPSQGVKGNEKDIEILLSGVFNAFDTEYIITAKNIGINVK